VTFRCIDCHRKHEWIEHQRSQEAWSHEAVLGELTREVNQRSLAGIRVEVVNSQWLGNDVGLAAGLRLHSPVSRGFGSYKTFFYFEILLKNAEIIGRWVTDPAMKRLTWMEVFRLPITEQNVPAAVNQAFTFIALKS